MRRLSVTVPALILAAGAFAAEAPVPTPTAPPASESFVLLPGAPPEGVMLDYLAIDRTRRRVWVPAGGTGNTVVIDATTKKIDRVEGFPTAEVERRGAKRKIGPSSATIGDGFVYVGNRADSSVCAVNAATLARGGCVTLPSSPDGVAFVAKPKEVWVTTPGDRSIVILDISAPATPKRTGSVKLEGDPEGYAVDDARGVFYTNLEDADKTVRIDIATRKVTAIWPAGCGERGPRGLALEADGPWLMVACTDHVEVLAAGTDGHELSKLETGDGVDNLDYLPGPRLLYAAAGGAARLTVARLGKDGSLARAASIPTSKGARNAVAAEDGTAYLADGPEGKILIVPPSR